MYKTMKISLYPIIACTVIGASFFMFKQPLTKEATMPRLIPRSVLFGNPERIAPRISPNGTKIAYSAPFNGVMNLWVKSIDGDQGEVITKSTDQPIMSYFWSPDGNQLLYLQDGNGDENSHVYGVDLETKKVRDYTPFENTRASVVEMSRNIKDTVLIAMNKENKALFDYYKLNLVDGTTELILKNPGTYSGVVFDKRFQPRAINSKNEDGSLDVLYWQDGAWVKVFTWDPENAVQSGLASLAEDDVSLYLESTTDSNTSTLVLFNPLTKTSKIIAQDPEYDFGGMWQDANTNKLLAVSFYKERKIYQALDAEFEKHLTAMLALNPGNMNIVSTNDDETVYIIAFSSDTHSTLYYSYDARTKKGTFLFKAHPDRDAYTFAPMQPISFKSRDGLKIHGYLTLPVGIEGKSLPLVLFVHGGPHLRDNWGFSDRVQWLSNRGYAVLQVNYRGSRGYGKMFERAGDREWGRNMQNDLVDAVEWAVKEGIADPKKVSIFGGSYGGYAALAGVTFTPDLFACGVSLCGPSNLQTFLETIPPYWNIYKSDLYRRIGDISETEFLKSRSPLFAADKLKVPLFIAQGGRDPRIKQAESEQFVAALKEKNIPCEYLLVEDEGHGFVKPHNKMCFYAQAEAFLAKHLGGRHEN